MVKNNPRLSEFATVLSPDLNTEASCGFQFKSINIHEKVFFGECSACLHVVMEIGTECCTAAKIQLQMSNAHNMVRVHTQILKCKLMHR